MLYHSDQKMHIRHVFIPGFVAVELDSVMLLKDDKQRPSETYLLIFFFSFSFL